MSKIHSIDSRQSYNTEFLQHNLGSVLENFDTFSKNNSYSDKFMLFFSDKETVADSLSTSELVVLVVGLLLAVLIMICVSLWCYREKQRQQKAGRVSG